MAKRPAATVKAVDSLLSKGEKGEYSSGNGLYLNVSGKGTGSWIMRYQLEGERKRLGLGSVEHVTLAEAGQAVTEQRALIAQGIDPQKHREAQSIQEQAEVITFDDVAKDYIEAQEPSWTNAKHAQQWKNTLATYASPVIGKLAPADITTEHLLAILAPIWNTKKETASRVRNRIEIVLNAAKARKLRVGENVAAWRGHLELLLAKHKGSDVKNHPALDYRLMASFWVALNSHTGVGADALKLLILTGLRTSEVLGASWQEFNLKERVWTIPAERMKAGKEHRVPLTQAVIDVLQSLPRVESGLLFEGRTQGKPVSNMTMLMMVRRMDKTKLNAGGDGWRNAQGDVITVHGFRSTFRDWAAEQTSVANIVVEQALAHTVGNAVEAAYRRGDLLERRRELMELWAGYVTKPSTSNVIQLRKEA